MRLSDKKKAREIHRLRAAGLTLAHAERLAKSQQGSGAYLAVAGGAFLLLVGAIAAVGLQSGPAQQIAQIPAPAVTPVTAPTVPPQPLPVTKPAEPEPANDLTRAIEAALAKEAERDAAATLAKAAPAPTLPTVAARADCVSRLESFLEPLFVQFELGSTQITPENAELLARVGDRMMSCPDAYIMVAGHADSSGDDAINMTLSWERADRTLNRLIALGVNQDSLEAVGFGARAPVSEGSSEDDGADRRVDFRVLRLKGDRP